MTTLLAVDGPSLVKIRVYTSESPALTDASAALDIRRCESLSTWVLKELLSFDWLKSKSLVVTVITFVKEDTVAVGSTLTAIVNTFVEFTRPRLHCTTPALFAQFAVDVDDRYAAFESNVSVTITVFALLLFRFVAVIV